MNLRQDDPPGQPLLGLVRFGLPWLLFGTGALLAIHFARVGPTVGESMRATSALLHRGYIGDPFLLPTGPSAHVSPLQAVYMACVYALCGVDSRAANVALGVSEAAIFALGAAVTLRLISALRLSRMSGWLTICILTSTSFLIYYTVTYCRVWEQPLSAVILVSGWLILVLYEQQRRDRLIILMSLLTGSSFLLTASITPSMLLALSLMIWMDRRRAGFQFRAVLASMIIAAIIVP